MAKNWIPAEQFHTDLIMADLMSDTVAYRVAFDGLKAEIQRSVAARRYAERWVAQPVLNPDKFDALVGGA